MEARPEVGEPVRESPGLAPPELVGQGLAHGGGFTSSPLAALCAAAWGLLCLWVWALPQRHARGTVAPQDRAVLV